MPKTITLSIVTEIYYFKEVLKTILSSILFHRTFTSTQPQELTNSLDIMYICHHDQAISNFIQEKINSININQESKKLLSVQFFEKKKKSWFQKEEDLCWEVIIS